MTKLFDVLYPEAREDLICDNVIELVTVHVAAVPDPEWPDDRLTMKISAEFGCDIQPGIPGIDDELDRIRTLCDPAGEYLSIAVWDDLHVALNRRRKELDGMKEEILGAHSRLLDPRIVEVLRPTLENPIIDVMVWCHCWTLAMDDDGKMIVDVDERALDYDGLDRASPSPG